MRLDRLTALADAYIVLAGGIGTLLELALVWNLRLLQIYPDKPIILLGPAWRATVDSLAEQLYIRDVDLAAFTFAETPADALTALSQPSAGSGAAPPDWRG
jgi:predicted Rossmann-fold nucleotide-binding protein